MHYWPILIILFLLIFPNKSSGSVDFSDQVAPIFYQKCLSCHNEEKAKGNYRLDQIRWINEPGESNLWPLKPANLLNSHLWQLISSNDPDKRMPLKADPLPPKQIRIIKDWILEGASFDDLDANIYLSSILPRPKYPKPPIVYRRPFPSPILSFSSDGKMLATSGIHEIFLFELTEKEASLAIRINNLPERIHEILWVNKSELVIAGGNPGRLGELLRIELANPQLPKITNIAITHDAFFSAHLDAKGTSILSVTANGRLETFSWPLGIPQSDTNLHSDWATDLVQLDKGENPQIFTVSRDKSIKSVAMDKLELDMNLTGFPKPLKNLSIHPNGQIGIAIPFDGHSIFRWNPEKQRKESSIEIKAFKVSSLLTHNENVWVGDKSGNLHMLDSKWRKISSSKRVSDHQIIGMSSHPTSGLIAISDKSGRISICNIKSLTPLYSFLNTPK